MKIGIIGAGNIGSNAAKLFVKAGHEVAIANSRGPETLTSLIEEIGSGAKAVTASGAAEFGEIVFVSIPLGKYKELPAADFAGKIVIDSNNYYPERDGQIAELDDHSTTSSALLQAHLPESQVVKAFNHIMAVHIVEHAQPDGTPGRRALAVASDHDEARSAVRGLLHEIGFDVVDVGSLADSWRIEPGTPGYGPRLDVEQLHEALDAATRA